MSVGERISELRKARSLSQGQLASMLEVSRQAVSKWENDQSTPDSLKLIKLADALDTEVEYLVTGVKPVYQSPAINVHLVKKVDKVVEKVVEKPVIYEKIVEKPVVRRVIRTRVKYCRNPLELAACGILGLIVGFVLGLLL